MDKKRVKRIIGEVLFWGAVVTFFVFATTRLRTIERSQRVTAVEVIVTDSLQRGFIEPATILTLLQESGLNPLGMLVEEVSLRSIKSKVESIDYVTDVSTYCNFEGKVTISLSQHSPRVRIISDQGHDFYLTDKLIVLPIKEHISLNMPIVTGTLPLPFEKDFTGDVRSLVEEGEKKYEENCNFLSKLIKFVDLTEQNSKYKGKIVQIIVTTPSEVGNGQWREPVVEFIPREGNYLVRLGKLEDVEAKLSRWRQFVEARVVELNDGVLNVEYEDQVLWKETTKGKKGNKKRE